MQRMLNPMRQTNPAFFKTPEAMKVGEQILLYQRVTGGWLKDNLKESEEKPEFHGVTALWTFNKKWDPEKRIRDLWDVLAY